MKLQRSITADLNALLARIYNDFKRIRKAIPEKVIPAAPVAGYTQAEVQKIVDDEKMRIANAFA